MEEAIDTGGQVSKDNWEGGQAERGEATEGTATTESGQEGSLAQRTTGCSGPAQLWAESLGQLTKPAGGRRAPDWALGCC